MTRLQVRAATYEFPGPALVMGILNVTPDSFSDGGRFLDCAAAVDRALELDAEGAAIIDIGGESTRPGSTAVSEEEEARRVLPVIQALAGRLQAVISIDTMKPAVARAAIDLGAGIINDVGASLENREMWQLAAETGVSYVCMHMQGTPATMQQNPRYGDVVREVGEFFTRKMERLRDCGVCSEQIILDPGIGFGKTLGHNLELLAGLASFASLQRPILLGVSRKSFLGKLAGGAGPEGRLAAGLACTCLALLSGAQIFRTHDVPETVQAVRTAEAILEQKKLKNGGYRE
jgi:dihydropteroate synthase